MMAMASNRIGNWERNGARRAAGGGAGWAGWAGWAGGQWQWQWQWQWAVYYEEAGGCCCFVLCALCYVLCALCLPFPPPPPPFLVHTCTHSPPRLRAPLSSLLEHSIYYVSHHRLITLITPITLITSTSPPPLPLFSPSSLPPHPMCFSLPPPPPPALPSTYRT